MSIKNVFICAIVFLVVTKGLYIYQSSNYVKNEFLSICNTSYVPDKDPIGYKLCLKPYSDEQNLAQNLQKIEIAIILSSLIVLTYLKIKPHDTSH